MANLSELGNFVKDVGFPIAVVLFVAVVYIGWVPSPLSSVDARMTQHVKESEEQQKSMSWHNKQQKEAIRLARESCIAMQTIARRNIRVCYEDQTAPDDTARNHIFGQ